jgi:hypothetical protein
MRALWRRRRKIDQAHRKPDQDDEGRSRHHGLD